MTDSLGELRAVLMEVRERLGEALAHAATARDRLVDAVGVLSDLDGQHSEPLVPPEPRTGTRHAGAPWSAGCT